MSGWNEEQIKEFQKLTDEISDLIHGKSLGIVLESLTTLIAEAGVDNKLDYKYLIACVTNVIDAIYKRDSNKSNQQFQ